MSIGERITAVRKALHKTQAAMAEAVSVSLSTWQTYEAGAAPKCSVLVRLLDLGFDVNWILSGQGSLWRRTGHGREAAEPAPRAAVPGRSLPVLGLVETETRGWYRAAELAVRAVCPADLPDAGAFGVIALSGVAGVAGIPPGCLCLCSAQVPAAPGEVVFVEVRRNRCALRLLKAADEEWIVLSGAAADESGSGATEPPVERLRRREIAALAPVIYVKRRL
jgi:transcriptional regulator with XRE-family HTH domain